MKTELLLNSTPQVICGVMPHDGNTFGIELELEGRGVGLQDVATRGWKRTVDNSLRGESIEFTTNGPKTLKEATELVKMLFTKFQQNKVVFNNSIRTSTHVHLNFSNKPLKQALNFFTLFEEVLGYYSGEDRRGNLFCISTREAEGVIAVLSKALANGSFIDFRGDRFKYAACNLSTLHKFGTVEVRTMRGANSADQVNNWLDILNDMYLYSLKMKSPAALINDLSQLGADGLMKAVFSPKNRGEVLSTFPKARNLHESLIEGARLIQLFAYDFEEAFVKEVKMEARAEKAVKIGRGVLPVFFPDGHQPVIYRPDGQRWACIPRHGPRGAGAVWQDGDTCVDNHFLEYNRGLDRFIVRYPNGDICICNWAHHPDFGDEGPADHREMPRVRRARPAFEDDDDHEEEEEF
jgi:hypothetical protein